MCVCVCVCVCIKLGNVDMYHIYFISPYSLDTYFPK